MRRSFLAPIPLFRRACEILQRNEGIVASQFAVLWAKDRIMGTLLIGWRSPREFSAAEINLLGSDREPDRRHGR